MSTRYALSGLLLSLTLALILEGALSLPLIFAWLIGINVFTFLFYAIDKLNSQSAADPPTRIPEASLLFLTLAGGTPGAALAIALLPHKNNDLAFMLPFLLILLGQVAAVLFFREAIPLP